MQAKMIAKVYWEGRDVAGLATKLTNGNRQISLGMVDMPDVEALGGVGSRATCDDPSIALVVMNPVMGITTDVTQSVLGGEAGDEHYASEDLERAVKWLMTGE